jgi:hypothetical protein
MSSTDAVINTVSVTYDYTNSGNWDGEDNLHNFLHRNPATQVKAINSEADPSGTGKGLVFVGDSELEETTYEVTMKFLSGRHWLNSDPGGQVTIKSVQITGVGDNPFD